MTRKPKTARRQLDLFAWADQRPTTAKILSAVPAIARRMWRERYEQPATREGALVAFPPRPIVGDERRRA